MNPNLGAGNAMLGGANDALSQVLAQQAQGEAGQTAAVSPASAGFDPSMMGGAPVAGGAPAPMPMADPSMGVGQPLPQQSPESQIIIDALNTRLKSISKAEEMTIKASMPPVPPKEQPLPVQPY